MEGYAEAQAADAQFAMAWLHLQRYAATIQDIEVLEPAATPLGLDVELGAYREFADEAKELGVATVQEVAATMNKVHRKTDQHWTNTAQAAGATYLLVLFGDESYVRDTISAYRSALEGREDEDYTSVLSARIRELQDR